MKKNERGAAIIVAILIVTLAASTATYAIWQQSVWVRQLENLGDRAKADQLATSAIDVARNVLMKDKPAVDSFDDDWAKPVTLPAEDATVSGQITDQQARFNLNNLEANDPARATQAKEAFKRLLDRLTLSAKLVDAVSSWVKQDENGSADLPYLSRNPPYRAALRKLVDVSELALVEGFDEETLRALTPHVTALENETAVNVNTATPEVLEAVFSDSTAKAIVNKRRSSPFTKLEEVKPLVPSTNNTCPPVTCYDVKSKYFTVRVSVKSGRVESGYTALLERSDGQAPSIKWRKDAAD